MHKSTVHDIAAANKSAGVSSCTAAVMAGLHYKIRSVLFVGLDEMDETTAIAAAPALAQELAMSSVEVPYPPFAALLVCVVVVSELRLE